MIRFGFMRGVTLVVCLVTRSVCCHDRCRYLCFVAPTAKDPSRNPILAGRSEALRARLNRRYSDDSGFDDTPGDRAVERMIERPTQTRPEKPRAAIIPSKPKIVVLGASGMIGRLVVRQLLEMPHLDATIVAFVRDFEKASRVLYDDVLVASANRNKRGPRLQLVVGDLVPAEDLPGHKSEESDRAWLARAESASTFYGKKVSEFDNQVSNDNCSDDEALQSAIQDCTTIINCVGTVRPTNVWTDLLARPFWRLFRSDVSGWCSDCRHPFYVHFQVTQKVVEMAETEQRRREALETAIAAESDRTVKRSEISRIRLIRVSDLCLTQAPWYLVPVLANMLHSMVLRYQDLAEKEMEASSVIDTVTLRPGDLVNEERDTATTTLQVDASGSLPCPARVGREDVAALAVASALFDSSVVGDETDQKTRSRYTDVNAEIKQKPFHYTLACRWTSEAMDPYPAQGQMADGHATAQLALQAAIRTLRGDRLLNRRRRSSHRIPSTTSMTSPDETTVTLGKRRKLKPYGIFVAVPFYLLVWCFMRSAQYCASSYLFPIMQRPNLSLGKSLVTFGTVACGFMNDCISLFVHTCWIRRSYSSKYISL